MTFAFGWCLANSESFLCKICNELGYEGDIKDCKIDLQRHDAFATGFTDVEIIIPGKFACVIEAKKSYTLPDMVHAGHSFDLPIHKGGQ